MKYFEQLALLKSIKGMGLVKINKTYCDFIKAHPDFNEFKECVVDDGIATSFEVAEAVAKINRTLNTVEQNSQFSIITCFDDEYPSRFNLLGNQRPVYFYVAGDKSILSDETVAVIGTRKPSEYGVSACRKIVGCINGSVVVSGLALGTDRIAHEAAITSALKTIAILPSGISNITPATNRQLAGQIADGNGCLISEYDFEDKAAKYTFLRRDSLVAALSDVVAVIECGEKSGTMHTVDDAIKMKKPIACYYTDRGGDYSGNKKLLNNGSAKRLTSPEDINAIIESCRSTDNAGGHQLSLLDM